MSNDISEHYRKALTNSVREVVAEVESAKSIFSMAFTSNHEGYAVLLEEVDELWDEVKKKHADKERIRKEATQIAAMALRIMVELTPSSHD